MSADNGIIKIGRKGLKKFAFGDGPVFEVDVVVAFQEWIRIDDSFRPPEDEEGNRRIPMEQMGEYHKTALEYVNELRNRGTRGEVSPNDANRLTTAEALDFLARLREQYDELANFFRPKSRDEPDSQDTSRVEHRFSAEES